LIWSQEHSVAIIRRPFACIALFVATGLIGFFAFRFSRPTAEQFARDIRSAHHRGDLDGALRVIDQAISRFPGSTAVRAAAAELELERGDTSAALQHLLHVSDDGSARYLDATATAGDLLFEQNRPTEAERCYRRVLQSHPANLLGQQRLALLLALSGRRGDALDAFFQIIRGSEFDTRDLALFGEPDQVFDNPELVKRFNGSKSSDPGALRGAARYALLKNMPTVAAGLYRQVLSQIPHDLDAQAGLGRAILDLGEVQQFIHWHAMLSPEAESSAEIWSLKGRFAVLRSESRIAIRCFGEALRRDPNQIVGNTQMGALLSQAGEPDLASEFRQRAEKLRELNDVFSIVLADGSRVDYLVRAADLTESLGRIWEAHGWCLAAAARGSSRELADRTERLAETLNDDVAQTIASANPASRLALDRFPLPDWKSDSPTVEWTTAPGTREPVRVQFADMAAAAGMNFQFFNGHDPAVRGFKIFETTGGGVAAFDFDGDHWPDLYFTQACEWPPRAGQREHLDQLFRNLGDGQFANVTAASGLGDDGYSQGVSAGDIDNDGFPDLYVANIGQNRLYLNNGDGTFSERTTEAGLTASGWTTSALLADLNGDGLPDIYDATYLAGRLPFEHVCHDREHKSIVRICAPSVFVAEPDRLFLNQGDGTFQNVSAEAGIAIPDGKGLGIVAFDLDGSGRLSLYVANDTTPNFLFVNQTAEAGGRPAFSEQAQLLGCAVNGDGIAPASMGIAIGDSDGDGLLDLFITTFHGEPAVLFRQQTGGFFVDATSPAGLKEPTVPTLGFGTQFLDGDLDGLLDLVLANGHVDDLRDRGIPYHMQPQYFAQRDHGRFVELSSAQTGDYFRALHLGRGVASLDWNRDGREDFAVSNLDTPASLVTNQTEGAGHFLALQLRGVQSSRDAIGATVTARVGERQFVRQLTAGDGYQASNQRQLVFGLGAAELVDELTIRWPTRQEQRFTQIAADAEYIVIEGRSDIIRLPPAGP
jgi:tetratricopeptide (TPR) repeat protein